MERNFRAFKRIIHSKERLFAARERFLGAKARMNRSEEQSELAPDSGKTALMLSRLIHENSSLDFPRYDGEVDKSACS